jgi:hypothetical protein
MSTNKQVLTLEVLTALGVTMANAFFDADKVATQSKRKVLLASAKAHAHDDTHVKAILDGYKQGFINHGMSDSSATVRRSEAKAVFEAVAKTIPSGANLKSLEKFEGEYNAFIEKARELRGVKERTSTERARSPKLTTKQYDTIEEGMEKATPKQLEEIATQAVINIHKTANASLAGFQSLLLIQATAAQMIKNEQVEQLFKDVAEQIVDLTATVIKQAREANEAANLAMRNNPVIATQSDDVVLASLDKVTEVEGEKLAA